MDQEIDNFISAMRKPMYYRRDGSPIFAESMQDATIEFAKLFEDRQYRTIAVTKTLYGERLSTVWLGIDHNFSFNPLATPIIFETMLFAPSIRFRVRASSWIRKLYPQDGSFQLRYATEAEAEAGHRRAKLQCLIPPLLRRLILYRLWKDDAWS